MMTNEEESIAGFFLHVDEMKRLRINNCLESVEIPSLVI